MKNHPLLSLLYICLLGLFISCENEEPEAGPCDDLKGRIHQEVKEMFPYTENLEAIIFENKDGEEFAFFIINKKDRIETVNANSEFPYEAERFEFELHNMELDAYLTITLYGSYATHMCPEIATPSGFVSIRGPQNSSIPSSSSSQSFVIVIIQQNEEEFTIQDPEISEFTWMDQNFNDVYDGSGEFKMYFNFETGLLGFYDPVSDDNYVFKALINE